MLDIARAHPLPRFPSIVRDLSILVDESLLAADVRGTIQAVAPPTLVRVAEFDRYQGKGIAEGKVSVSYRLTFQAPDRTLTDAEADARDGDDRRRADQGAWRGQALGEIADCDD